MHFSRQRVAVFLAQGHRCLCRHASAAVPLSVLHYSGPSRPWMTFKLERNFQTHVRILCKAGRSECSIAQPHPGHNPKPRDSIRSRSTGSSLHVALMHCSRVLYALALNDVGKNASPGMSRCSWCLLALSQNTPWESLCRLLAVPPQAGHVGSGLSRCSCLPPTAMRHSFPGSMHRLLP